MKKLLIILGSVFALLIVGLLTIGVTNSGKQYTYDVKWHETVHHNSWDTYETIVSVSKKEYKEYGETGSFDMTYQSHWLYDGATETHTYNKYDTQTWHLYVDNYTLISE